jgi:hypothetical protein
VKGPGAAVKEEVEAGMWRKVAVGASERRVMEAMAGAGVGGVSARAQRSLRVWI